MDVPERRNNAVWKLAGSGICALWRDSLLFEHTTRFGDLEEEEDDAGFPILESKKSGSSCGCKEKRTGINPCDSGSKQGFQRVQRKKWRNIGRDINLCDEFEGVCCEKEDRDVVLIQPVEGKEAKMMSLGFQVASVKKPFIAVKRIVEKGNVVQFGKKDDDNFISNVETGDKMMLKPNGKGSFVMQVKFSNGEQTEITVDSGAEENVCPW